MGPGDSRGVMGAAKENDPARPSEGTCLCFLPGGGMAGFATDRFFFLSGGRFEYQGSEGRLDQRKYVYRPTLKKSWKTQFCQMSKTLRFPRKNAVQFEI